VPRAAASGPSPKQVPDVTRRAVLAGAVLGGPAAAALAGCSKKRPEQLKAHPDVAVLLAAIATEERLVALYESTRATHQDLARRIDPMLAHHRDHLSALRRHYVPGTGSEGQSVTPTPAPTQSADAATDATAPRSRRQALVALHRAERRAAAARLADVTRVTPGMAQLLASIGACEAGHATWLAGVS
jgi:hypothetical protein